MSTQLTITGNLTKEPELRFTPQGKAVCRLTIATSKGVKKPDGSWENKDNSFWNCVLWDKLAENAADSLQKGDSVVAFGQIKDVSWEKDGAKVYSKEVNLWNIGIDLKRFSVKADRSAAGKAAAGGAAAHTGLDPWSVAVDPWAQNEAPPF
jgi:single-strand DNA-binding protein